MPTLDGKKMKIGNSPELRPGPSDTFMSYDLPWANVSNTPFRLYKSWVHEGGISTPFILSWPKKIKKSGLRHCSIHIQDIMPTCIDSISAKYPILKYPLFLIPRLSEGNPDSLLIASSIEINFSSLTYFPNTLAKLPKALG